MLSDRFQTYSERRWCLWLHLWLLMRSLTVTFWQGRRGVVPMDVVLEIQKPIAMYLVAMVDSCAGAIQSDLILS